MSGTWEKLEDEEMMNDDVKLNPLLAAAVMEQRRGSIDTRRKNSWTQKLNPRLMFSKGTKSGTATPNDYSRVSNLKQGEKKFRSQSIDLGGTLISPLYGYKAMTTMFRQDEEFIGDDENDADREIHSINSKKFLMVPPPGTIEYTVSGNDTLASIAAKHRSTTSELRKINRLMSPLVFPGQKLFVPTESYVPVGYGSQTTSPRCSPNPRKPRSGSVDHTLAFAVKTKVSDSEDSKKQKKTKGRSRDRRPSEALELFFKGNRNWLQKEETLFKAQVEYVTGGQDSNVSGLMEITKSEVKFEPDLEGGGKGLLKDLVRYRMALGKALVSANIVDNNPYNQNEGARKASFEDGAMKFLSDEDGDSSAKKVNEKILEDESETVTEKVAEENYAGLWSDYANQEAITFRADTPTQVTNKDSEVIEQAAVKKEKQEEEEEEEEEMNEEETANDEASTAESSPVKYLLLKLGIPRKASKDWPTISSLIKSSLTVNVTVEHCFVIPNEIVDDLIDFLKRNYPNIYGKSDAESTDRFDGSEDVKRPAKSKRGAIPFKRNLSVAELCNLPLPEMSHQSSFLTETHIRILLEHLLPKVEGRPWKLAYSSSVHGYSINTLYRSMVKNEDMTTLLAVQDMENKIFGAMLPCSIRQSDGFYGSGESFLFTFYPVFKKFCWSGKNSFFLRGSPQSFSIGSGDGVFGLWLHDDLNHGRTQRCETYDNDLLTGSTEDFYMRCIEIWQFPFSLEE